MNGPRSIHQFTLREMALIITVVCVISALFNVVGATAKQVLDGLAYCSLPAIVMILVAELWHHASRPIAPKGEDPFKPEPPAADARPPAKPHPLDPSGEFFLPRDRDPPSS